MTLQALKVQITLSIQVSGEQHTVQYYVLHAHAHWLSSSIRYRGGESRETTIVYADDVHD